MWRIPLSDLNYDEAEQEAVAEVLRSKWLSMGPRTEEFEARAAEYLGVRHAVAVTNCTCALEMAYQLLMQRGSAGARVVVPDITFVATANAALLSGASVDFLDICEAAKPVLSGVELERYLAATSGGGTPVIVAPVHYAGFDAGIEELVQMARAHGAQVVEDAAHGIGARTSSGKALGTVGNIGCYSFFANKNLATGEGGLVVTNDEEIAAGLCLLRSHGMTSLTWQRHSQRGHGYDVISPGHNYRITEITAALALVQLSKLDAGNERRQWLYRAYRDLFSGEPRLTVPFAESDDLIGRSACHIFPLVCADEAMRDAVRSALNDAGIQTSHHYPPVHTFTFYQSLGQGDEICPQSRDYAVREITLPLHPGLKEVELEEVTDIVLRTVRGS